VRTVILTVFVIAQFLILSCSQTCETVSKAEANPDFYLSQSSRTDPGELAFLFESLPRDNDALCGLIKKQFIHPAEIGQYRDVLAEERYFEDTTYQSVSAMLSGLLKYDSRGLTMERDPQDRLVVACLHHSLLFASVLRERGVPVRIRFGFAPYIGRMFGKDLNVAHVVCEVWDDEKSGWIYVDPDRHMVGFPSEDFICGSEAWQKLRQHDIDVDKVHSAFFTGEQSILDMLRLDLLYALREERMYWGEFGAPDVPEMDDLASDEIAMLDHIAELMKYSGSHIEELERLRAGIDYLR